MKTILLTISAALCIGLYSGCAGSDIGPAAGADYRVYAVTPDALAPAIEETMADMRWRIEDVEILSPSKYMVTGIYGAAPGGRVSRAYRVQIIVESVQRNLTSVKVAISDSHPGHGPTIDYRRLRNDFFREIEKREVVFPEGAAAASADG